MTAPTDPVTTLLAVYNGASFLREQLDSLAAQGLPSHGILAGDDGSTDGSVALLKDFAHQMPVDVIDGPRQGFAPNFLNLIRYAPAGQYLALCDQDDVWLSGKLTRALEALSRQTGPALYCSRRWIWDGSRDDGDTPHRASRNYESPPGFGNALVENIAPGNTIVLNPAAAELARAAVAFADGIFAHDWWLYQIVTGAGGRAIFDPEPTLLYRQHGGNVLGAGETRLRSARLRLGALGGAYRDRIDRQTAALRRAWDLLDACAQDQLDAFDEARCAPWSARQALLRRAGVYRNGAAANLALKGAVQFGLV